MAQINPYIHFNGNTEEAFLFYKSAFGGEFSALVRLKDMRGDTDSRIKENEGNKIMHIALSIGSHSVLMASDVPEFMGKVSENENRSKILVRTESKEEADTLFNKLSAGGTVEMPISDNPWGSYFGMFRDKFGIEWMIEFNQSQNSQK